MHLLQSPLTNMISLALLGKLAGTVIVGPLTEKLGHKRTMFITCSTQIVGVIST